ncbi:hypothetical protein ABZ707_29935 [Streptomyces sp. NPDC006923]|uniref:hypothetical protein n=1 Tax=Streptomyces sp. NPDC006923 TaxID=3155355 RepID=UPI0034091D49
MAIELTDVLVNLQCKALEEGATARAVPYSAEAWAPWLEAAQTAEAAITEFAREKKHNRPDVAVAVRHAAREAMSLPHPGENHG